MPHLLNTLPWITFCLALVGFIISIIALVAKRKVIHKEIVFEDEAIKLENGIIYARGFSNEPYKTNKISSLIKDEEIVANRFSDGMTNMSNGNLEVYNKITSKSFSDNILNIQNGSITTSGSITADHIIASRSMDIPAQFYADVHMLEMQPVNFSKTGEWKNVAESTNGSQLFFAGYVELHHGVTLLSKNKIQLNKTGKWLYQYKIIVTCKGQCVVRTSFNNNIPKLADGYASGSDTLHVSGFGIIDIKDTDKPCEFFFQHQEVPTSEEYFLYLNEGHIMLKHLGK